MAIELKSDAVIERKKATTQLEQEAYDLGLERILNAIAAYSGKDMKLAHCLMWVKALYGAGVHPTAAAQAWSRANCGGDSNA